MSEIISFRSQKEETANALTHALGVLFSLIAFVFMLENPSLSPLKRFSVLVFLGSMLLLYSSSTLYHGVTETSCKSKVRFFDHISIYFLIAGSYTPFLLISVGRKLGWWFFCIIWLVALIGVVYKIFWWKKYPKISLYLYLGMGWVVLFIAKPLFQSLSLESIIGLILGGFFYSAGTIFYSMKSKAYSHVIWHMFVLMGSASHFFAVVYML